MVAGINERSERPGGWPARPTLVSVPIADMIACRYRQSCATEKRRKKRYIADQTVAPDHRGKYLALPTTAPRALSDGMAHLQRLAEVTVPGIVGSTQQGVTHVHLLPIFDIATINRGRATAST